MPAEQKTRYVGPIISDQRVAEAVARAIATDNGQAPKFEDRGAYVRIGLPTSCRLTQASLDEELGGELRISAFESVMPSFAGRIKVSDDEIIWYLEETK
ncbi:MmoB/DmpM family protein [Capillimicrobium parvum]|uniref:Alkene monooxygenase system, effector subunit n=1 Tax=Capillimicrobium parvum TaxID=2884022 RepID=A0A9E6XZ39_9ACTN|nr:MmoB/DmpM family protein [Capillimicrobium parvum]UGS37217.1 Alkene monooxygenase system, effector subunit [Capillimicrobium parvum]